MDWESCPDCRAGLPVHATTCPLCRLPLTGMHAETFLAAVAELNRLEERRRLQFTRRDRALERLRAERSTPPVEEPSPPVEEPALPEEEVAPVRPRRDLSHHAVQNLLLLLGGVLLSIAAVVFTLVSWQIPTLRALILSAFTLLVLALPWLLVRRRLAATAETVAFLGLVLIPLDGIAVGQALAAGTPSAEPAMTTQYWGLALAGAGLSALWALYALLAPLRLPAPTALVLAQPALPLAGIALLLDEAGWFWLPAALIVTAALDLTLWLAARRARAAIEYVTAAVAGTLAWILGTGAALTFTTALITSGYPQKLDRTVPFVGVLAGAALVAAFWAVTTRGRTARTLLAAGAGLAAAGALSAIPYALVEAPWRVGVYAVAGLLVVAAARALPHGLRLGVRSAGALVLGASALWVAPGVLTAALGPLSWPLAVWGDETGYARDLLGPHGLTWEGTSATPAVLACVALATVLAVPRNGWWLGSLAGSTAVLTLPVATDLSQRGALVVLVALAGALLVFGTLTRAPRTRTAGEAALWMGGFVAVLVACWSLVERPATIAVAAALTLLFLINTIAARRTVTQTLNGVGLTFSAALLAWAVFDPAAAFALLAVRALTLGLTRPSRKLDRAVLDAKTPVVTVVLGALAQLTRTVRPGGRTAVEAAAVVVSAAALLATGLDQISLVLAGAAVLAAAGAWRRPRGWWRALAVGEACLLATLAPLPLAKAFFPALIGPYGWLTQAWAGAPDGAREALSPGGAWQEQPLLLPVLLLASLAAVLAAGAQWGRHAATGVALVAFPTVATTLPLVADLPYWAALAFLVALTAGLALWSAISRSAAGGASLWTAALAVSWSLADETATLAVLAAIVVTGVLCAIRGKGSPVTSVASGVTALAVGAESVAAALGSGLTEQNSALIALFVAVLIARAAALPKLPMAVAQPLYATALVVWGVAALMCRDLERVTLVLAVGGLAVISVTGRLPSRARFGAVSLAAFAAFAALLPHTVTWLMTFARPYTRLQRIWSGSLEVYPLHWSLDRSDTESWVLPDQMIALAVAALVTVTAVGAVRGLVGNAAARAVATVGVPLCLVMLPAVAGLTYGWHVIFLGSLVVALAVQAALDPRPLVAGWMALVLSTQVIAWSLPSQAATLWVLAGVGLVGAVLAVRAADGRIRAGAAETATFAFGGLTVAAALAAGLELEQAGFALLATSALAALVAARVTGAVEVPGWCLTAAGVAMTMNDGHLMSLALACSGVLALAVALRRDRRWTVWPGLGLLQVALWIELVLEGVQAPEAYTVPLTVAGLVAAWLVRKRDPDVSSWMGYGSALALTYAPSLVVAWSDPALTRPLLLGAAAFATTLAGAWWRLQAPLLLGGTVLLVTAVHEFAPTLAELVDEGPRWVPIALAGAFLLFTGATYEHRLRDLRRVRRLIVRMR